MNEATRTLVFVGVAAASVAVAAVTHFSTKPDDFAVDQLIGEEFYPEFDDPTAAVALEVVAYNEDTATAPAFEVKLQDGRWIIPSHHNYPADAKDRLEKTAASIVGIQRDALASRFASAHEEYGVIAPDDKSAETLLGRGQRIRLVGPNDKVLADYIIGKKVERGEGDGFHQNTDEGDAYYVRLPDDSATYIARLDIDLSTKFSDWIESDLLRMDRDDLVRIDVNKYSIDERRGAILNRERSVLTREESFDPWKLDGLDESKEEVDTDHVRELVNGLVDLKIVGVRRKPAGLRPDLSIDPQFEQTFLEGSIVQDMAEKGFLRATIQETGENMLLSNEGELIAATNKGVVYTLRFGEVFTGSEFDIEVGFASDKKKDGEKETGKKNENKKKTASSDSDEADADDADEDDDQVQNKSRYLLVSVAFDEQYIGEKPEKPAEPAAAEDAKPEDGEKPAADDKPDENGIEQPEESPENGNEAAAPGEEKASADADGNDEESTEPDANDDEAESQPDPKSDSGDEPPKEDEKEKADEESDAEKKAEEARKKYEEDLKKYEEDLKDHEKKVKDGQELVEELSERFAGWYYVISAESFEDLRLSRADLVKAKEKDDTDAADDQPAEAKKPEPREDLDGNE